MEEERKVIVTKSCYLDVNRAVSILKTIYSWNDMTEHGDMFSELDTLEFFE